MKKIFNYPLKTVSEQTVSMPSGAQILSVHSQNGYEDLILWALIQTDNPPEERHLRVYQAHRPIEEGESLRYIGFVYNNNNNDNRATTWHIFERT